MAGNNQSETCPRCEGTGWIRVAKADGRPEAVTRCECHLQARTEHLLDAARIPRRYRHCTLADFDIHFDGADRTLASARLKAGRFVEEYPLSGAGLLFLGPVGVGKTHLAAGLLRELIAQKSVRGLFADYRELLKQIQDSYNPSVQATEMSILAPVFEAEVLVLDELGAVRPSEWVWDTVSLILNTRYNEKRTTVVTTNYPNRPARAAEGEKGRARFAAEEETLGDRIGERMRSRLMEMCRPVEMTGADFRQRVQNASFR